MWEAIARNKLYSKILLLCMGVILLVLGAAVGGAVEPQGGILFGAVIAVVVWLIFLLTALFAGDSILLNSAGASEIKKEDAPQLWNVVEEMTIASGLGRMPRVFLIEDYAPNAFAVGRKPESASVAVTSGLVERLNRDELQGVVAHEIGHIVNQDTRFLTIASVMLGSIVMISDLFLHSLRFGGRRRTSRRDSDGGGGQAQIVFFLVALALAILGPILAQILYFAVSRRREYLADASGALFTRYPEGLASALEKIALKAQSTENANRALAPLYIVNPLQSLHEPGLFSTHPSTETRIRILREMGGGAGYVDYEKAFEKVVGEKKQCLGEQTLKAAPESVPAREASVEPVAPADGVGTAPDAGLSTETKDLLNRLGNLIPITCDCGVVIKAPSGLKASSITCPRCGRLHMLPSAQPQTAADETASQPLQYTKKTKGWETFRCTCGRNIQLSPGFAAPRMKCPSCGSRISIDVQG